MTLRKTISVILLAVILFSAVIVPSGIKAQALIGGKTVVTVDGTAEGTKISDNLFGIFFEDISFAADGGLSSNQLANNSFEYGWVENRADELKMTSWTVESGEAAVYKDNPLNDTNPTCLKASANTVLINEGYPDVDDEAGIQLTLSTDYDFSFYADSTAFSGTVSAYLADINGRAVTEKEAFDMQNGWNKYSCVFTAKRTVDTVLYLEIVGEGELYLDFFSLISHDSFGYGDEAWKYSTLRKDLFEALRELSPAFVRFPGGCCTEGSYAWDTAYDWKKTIGPLEQREQTPNLWGYNQSYSIGFYEYFLMCEALRAEPIPVLHSGLMCQARGNTDYMDIDSVEFAEYIQDLLDLIEYANGSVDTEWGAVRAANGHPEPFGLKYLGIGNENWGTEYFKRFDIIHNAVKEAYPEITVISSAGCVVWGDDYEYAWDEIAEKYTDTIVDEHYYVEPNWLLDNTARYDSFDRDSAKVFVGEFAAHRGGGQGLTKSNFQTAIAEAAYMTGLERNGDIVELAAYAPLFGRLNHYQWAPNLIWFGNGSVIKTTSYFVQQLFMQNTGNTLAEYILTTDTKDVYASVTVDTENEIIYVKVVNYNSEFERVSISLNGFDNLNSFSEMRYFGSALYNQGNTEAAPSLWQPEYQMLTLFNDSLEKSVGPYSLNVFRIGYGENETESLCSQSTYLPGNDMKTVFIAVVADIVSLVTGSSLNR